MCDFNTEVSEVLHLCQLRVTGQTPPLPLPLDRPGRGRHLSREDQHHPSQAGHHQGHRGQVGGGSGGGRGAALVAALVVAVATAALLLVAITSLTQDRFL